VEVLGVDNYTNLSANKRAFLIPERFNRIRPALQKTASLEQPAPSSAPPALSHEGDDGLSPNERALNI